MLGGGAIEVRLTAVPARRRASVKLIKGKRLGQPENTVADFSEKMAQNVLDLSGSVDVLVSHQHFIIEVVPCSKVQCGSGRPA
jgi:hypothetical protein